MIKENVFHKEIADISSLNRTYFEETTTTIGDNNVNFSEGIRVGYL